MSHVWYAAYGSNLSKRRFDIYLHGGQPDGASHRYPGCRDASEPERDAAGEIEAELCFGGWSQTWGGGVAFVRPTPGATTKARLYLVTLEQFEDVVAQENWLVPGSISIEPSHEQIVLDGDHTYRVVIPLGVRPHAGKDIPMLTISQFAAADIVEPTPAYLRYIAEGLAESHGLDREQIVAYLSSAPGAPPPEGVAQAVS